MPELQEVDEDRQSSEMYQVEVGVSHQELCASSPPVTNNWLAELANIATSPQSPLLKDAPHKRLAGPVLWLDRCSAAF